MSNPTSLRLALQRTAEHDRRLRSSGAVNESDPHQHFGTPTAPVPSDQPQSPESVAGACTKEEKKWSVKGLMTKTSKKETAFAWCMLILVFVESSFLFLQAGKSFQNKEAGDLDLPAFCILLFANVCWVFYAAFVVYDLPLLLSGCTYVVGSILILVTIILYGNKSSSDEPIV